MDTIDLFLAPLYAAIIYFIAKRHRDKHYPEGHPYRQYYMTGLTLKMVGAIVAGLIYFFYYRNGDTIFYYQRTSVIYEAFQYSFMRGLRLVFIDSSNVPWDLEGYMYVLRFWDTGAYMVVRISGLLSLICFNSYAAISLIFAYLSFRGVWSLFLVFADMYPSEVRRIALACLYIPSVFFWGSGLFKDTITLACVGWMTYAAYKVFFKREQLISASLMFIVAFYVTFITKAYIVMCFVPSILLWIFFTYNSSIKSAGLRVAMAPIVLILSAGMGYLFMQQLGAQNQYWSLDSVSDRAKDMQWWHTRVHELYGDEGGGGSTYSIGDGSFTPGNIIRSFPLAVNASLFRPYLWESNNPVMLLAALESLILLFVTLRVTLRAGLFKLFGLSVTHPAIFFCMFFSISFAFAVGFTSFNFGALVRYKIPLLPFYAIGLTLIHYHTTSKSDKKLPELATTE